MKEDKYIDKSFGDFKVKSRDSSGKYVCECETCGYTTLKNSNTLKKWKNYCPNCKSIIGKTYGDYLVVKRIDSDDKYKYLYECKCNNCGHIENRSRDVIVRTNNLCRECNSNFAKREEIHPIKDLTGVTFGELTVIKFLYRENRKTMWECECNCGNKCEKTSSYLRSINNPMCPKCSKEKSSERAREFRLKASEKENDVKYFDDYALINDKFKVDIDDVEKLLSYKRYIKENNSGYGCMYYNDNQIFIHRLVMGLPLKYDEETKIIADHINGDRKDNRKTNLRIIVKENNPINCGIYKSNTSGHKGVQWNKRLSKWVACIQVDKKSKHLGVFENYDDAVFVREQAEEKYYGEYNRKDT